MANPKFFQLSRFSLEGFKSAVSREPETSLSGAVLRKMCRTIHEPCRPTRYWLVLIDHTEPPLARPIGHMQVPPPLAAYPEQWLVRWNAISAAYLDAGMSGSDSEAIKSSHVSHVTTRNQQPAVTSLQFPQRALSFPPTECHIHHRTAAAAAAAWVTAESPSCCCRRHNSGAACRNVLRLEKKLLARENEIRGINQGQSKEQWN